MIEPKIENSPHINLNKYYVK